MDAGAKLAQPIQTGRLQQSQEASTTGNATSTRRSSEVRCGAAGVDSGGVAGRVEAGGLVRRGDRGEGEIDPGAPTASAERYVASVTGSAALCLDAHQEVNTAHARSGVLTIELVDSVSLKLDDRHRFGDQPPLMAVIVGPSPT